MIITLIKYFIIFLLHFANHSAMLCVCSFVCKKPPVSDEVETSSEEETRRVLTTASSLYSTEKPTSLTPETEQTVTAADTEEASSIPETNVTFTTSDEEGYSTETTDVSSKDSAVPTGSSLFSTEKPTSSPVTEVKSFITGETERVSIPPDTYKTEPTSVLSPTDDDSGDQTEDMFTQIPSVTSTSPLYSTAAPTAESLETDKTEMPSLTGQPSFSPVSDEVETSSETLSSSLAPAASSTFTEIEEDFISSQPTMVESIPSIQVSSKSPETASILFSTVSEGSGDSTSIFTEELIMSSPGSLLFSTESPSVTASGTTDISDTSRRVSTTASSLYSTEKPASLTPETEQTVTAADTEEASSILETNVTFSTSDEEGYSTETTDVSSKDSAVPTGSSLFSTKKPISPPVTEVKSFITGETERVSMPPDTYKTEPASFIGGILILISIWVHVLSRRHPKESLLCQVHTVSSTSAGFPTFQFCDSMLTPKALLQCFT